MAVVTTADEAVNRAREHIEKAREEIAHVMVERKTMWGADSFKDGYIVNVFLRLEALSRAIDGEDADGNAKCAEIDGA